VNANGHDDDDDDDDDDDNDESSKCVVNGSYKAQYATS